MGLRLAFALKLRLGLRLGLGFTLTYHIVYMNVTGRLDAETSGVILFTDDTGLNLALRHSFLCTWHFSFYLALKHSLLYTSPGGTLFPWPRPKAISEALSSLNFAPW